MEMEESGKPISGYAGKTLMQREIVALVAPHWPNSKVKATATAIAESKGSLGAWHDNYDPDNNAFLSRDCGLFQINIQARYVGTQTEADLRTESMDAVEYKRVATNNVMAAYRLYTTPWIRDGKQDIRKWQPWVAYTSGWAMFPEAWVWHQEDGEPVGPWVPTGRYLHQAIRAVANWHLLIAKDMDREEAVAEAKRLASYWNIKDGTILYSDRNAVYWKYPTKPTAPPVDGVGPRPKSNNGV